jgi:microcystin-dependent protein
MSDPYLGEIRMVGFNFAPVGWAFCAGQQLGVSQNAALFALLGTNFGGNGQTSFQLPNLQGRSPVGMGAGQGLTPIELGESDGAENAQVLISNMPVHNHPATQAAFNATLTGSTTIVATTNTTGATAPESGSILGSVMASGRVEPSYYPSTSTPKVNLASAPTTVSGQVTPSTLQIGNNGSGVPLAIRNPYLGMNFIIALEGIFPSRG